MAHKNIDPSALKQVAEGLGVNLEGNTPFDSVVYLLRMCWLGRFDKMSTQNQAALCAMSKLYLDGDDYEAPTNGVVVMKGKDHHALSASVVRQFFSDLEKAQAAIAPSDEQGTEKIGVVNQWFADHMPRAWGRWWASQICATTYCTKWLSSDNPELTLWQRMKRNALCLTIFAFAGELPLRVTIQKGANIPLEDQAK